MKRRRPPLPVLHYERHHEPLLPAPLYHARVVLHAAVAFAVIGGSLAIGVIGYRLSGRYPWLDCLYNAAMILGGMGPVSGDAAVTPRAVKWFASAYALYSGIALLTSVGLLIAPVVHRVMHRFHLEQDEPRS